MILPHLTTPEHIFNRLYPYPYTHFTLATVIPCIIWHKSKLCLRFLHWPILCIQILLLHGAFRYWKLIKSYKLLCFIPTSMCMLLIDRNHIYSQVLVHSIGVNSWLTYQYISVITWKCYITDFSKTISPYLFRFNEAW